ncbi:MAG: 5'-3' exonuclease H3TH domain-containing protein, partial [Oscillospiraceae bacterium]
MKLLAIDGNSIINRAFYGIKLLTTKSGTYTNGIVGFMNILNKLIDMEAPQAIVIGFDLRAKTFRHKAYSEYKAGRKGMPDELAEQMPVLKKLLCLLGYTCLELEGFEADDILGTLSKICEQNGSECVIATGDRDALQLVSDKTKVLLSTTKMGGPQVISFTPDEVMDKYGVLPRELIDIKALQGDASDNIPGVAGIGEKTAGDLISRFHNIDYIYENLETLEIKEPVRNKLRLGKDNAYMSRYLGTVNCTVPIESNIESYITKPFESRELYALLSDLEMFKLIEKLGISGEPSLPFEAETSLRVKSADILELTEKIDCVFDEEKLNLQVKSANSICNITDISEIKKIFSGGRPLRVYNSKAIYKWCMKQNIDINNIVFDSQLAAYLVNPSLNDYDLVHLAAMYSYEINDENIACVHS